MNILKTKKFFLCVISTLLFTAFQAHSDTATFTFDHMLLEDGNQITGKFTWVYSADDFEGGSGTFSELDIPYTNYSFADDNLSIDIQTDFIEISGNGDFHDEGLDISIVLSQPFAPNQSVPLDLSQSFFECCGNGFEDQPFSGGSISPAMDPSTSPGMELTGLITTRATCIDKTTRERQVMNLAGALNWFCGEAGIFPQEGDAMQLVTTGRADGISPVTATLNNMVPRQARCQNQSNGSSTGQIRLSNSSLVDCEAEGLVVNAGDSIKIIGIGQR
jgi:hypothetical protein